MIYTVTFNPSLDYVADVSGFELGMTNRTTSEHIMPGGKGINVSIVLENFGVESLAIGFKSGFTGEQIELLARKEGCDTDFIGVCGGMSRINVKLRTGMETEINGQGPILSDDDIQKLLSRLCELESGDILVMAGSIPNGTPDTIYRDIIASLKAKGIMVIVDASKNLLLNTLSEHPFLIKPNNFELSEIIGRPLETNDEIIAAAKKLQSNGALNVLVSMAEKGAVLVTENGKTYVSEAPHGNVKNSVGAGDSMVAGFIIGYLENKDYAHAFKMGIAAGSASAFSEGLAKKDETLEIYKKISL